MPTAARQVVLDQCQFTDGRSAERVIQCVLDEIGSARTPRGGMKICHVAPELLPVPPTKGGAIERWIRDAAVRLARRGHELHVISRDHGDGATSMRDDGVTITSSRFRRGSMHGLPAAVARGLWYYSRVRALLAGICTDIVHHHSRPAGLWLSGGVAGSVISLHSMDYGWGFGYRGWDRPLFTRGFRRRRRVLCVSDFIRAPHRRALSQRSRRTTTTVYNGVDGGHVRGRRGIERRV